MRPIKPLESFQSKLNFIAVLCLSNTMSLLLLFYSRCPEKDIEDTRPVEETPSDPYSVADDFNPIRRPPRQLEPLLLRLLIRFSSLAVNRGGGGGGGNHIHTMIRISIIIFVQELLLSSPAAEWVSTGARKRPLTVSI